MTKACNKCKQDKDLCYFWKDKSTKSGLQRVCVCCQKEYRQIKKRAIAKYKRDYYESNKEFIDEYQKKYRDTNSDHIKTDAKIWREENRDKLRAYFKKRYEENKNDILKKQYIRTKKRRKTDPVYRLTLNLRRRLNLALSGKNKSSSTIKLLGCTFEHARSHLESQFTDGMNWNNYGVHGWHVDHIIPCASFDLTDPEQQRQCFNYTNLQPLWAEDNLRKSDKLPHEYIYENNNKKGNK